MSYKNWVDGRTGAMVERYAHLAPEQLATAAARLDSVLTGYD